MNPIIIAECCQNHSGEREVLKRMVHEAAENGADYVKIQAIRSAELTRRDRFEEGVFQDGKQVAIKRPYKPEYQRLSKLDLSPDDEAWFADECSRAGVNSMITVFTRKSARDVCDLGYDAVKLASYDCGSFPLLRDVRKWWSKIFVSTGASFNTEVQQAADILKDRFLVFLHCVTIYPTPMDECHFRRMRYLRRFTPFVGWSDHTLVARDGLWASKIALGLGADCIERHFTVLPAGSTKDGPVSITPSGLKELRNFANMHRQERMEIIRKEYPDWEITLGDMKRSLSNEELFNRDYYRGRFASKDELGDWVYNWEDISLG